MDSPINVCYWLNSHRKGRFLLETSNELTKLNVCFIGWDFCNIELHDHVVWSRVSYKSHLISHVCICIFMIYKVSICIIVMNMFHSKQTKGSFQGLNIFEPVCPARDVHSLVFVNYLALAAVVTSPILGFAFEETWLRRPSPRALTLLFLLASLASLGETLLAVGLKMESAAKVTWVFLNF